jgi:signal transduction histidine kinase
MFALLSNLLFVLRSGLAWLLASMIVVETLSDLIKPWVRFGGIEAIWLIIGAIGLLLAFSHLRRVRLIGHELNASTLANRHRRQIEVPLMADATFALLDAAIRELPGVDNIESAPDSLQVRAKIKRINPYHSQTLDRMQFLHWLDSGNNQILATVTPGDEVSSVTFICEPNRSAWTDWFIVDNGTNLENAEALTRAISRRVAESRKQEKASAQQTVTEKELTTAKLSLLHAQVEPHFLYNTLASAQLLTRSDPARADQMLGNLITYLRHSLPRTEDSLSTIGVELERAQAYLDIMKIRMGSRLQCQIEVADYLKPVLFPSMMLQTLVENAIKHGLEPKSGGGTIWILARAHENTVAVTVADDGRGFSAEGAGTGIGLRNVRERLRLAYASTAHFGIVANFPNGVAATITVPSNFLQGEQHV